LNNHVNAQKLGQYLGQNENIKVLDLLIADFSFEGCSVDEALRSLLTDIVLPGDMDQMDQILTAFSEAHHRANPRDSTSADTVYALSFAVVLLSLSLHSPTSVHARVTPEVSPSLGTLRFSHITLKVHYLYEAPWAAGICGAMPPSRRRGAALRRSVRCASPARAAASGARGQARLDGELPVRLDQTVDLPAAAVLAVTARRRCRSSSRRSSNC
jgi:hypothetical protein